ncbi:MAG: multidrug effflux MFS transporter [Pseudomonadota bacterium]
MFGAKHSFIVILLIFALIMGEMANNIYVPSLPLLVAEFQVGVATISVSIGMGLLGCCLAFPVYGPLSDRLGRQQVLLTGILIFIFGSLLCYLATSASFFSVARLIQGVGIAAPYILGIAVIRDLFDHSRFSKIMSFIHMAIALAPAMAPIIGGYVTFYLGWRQNFFLIAVAGAILWFWMRLSMPETLSTEKRRSWSFADVIADYRQVVLNPAFVGYSLISGLVYAGLWAYLATVPYVFEALGVGVKQFGYYQSLLVGVYAGGAYFNSRVVEQWGVNYLLSRALSLTLFGAILFLSAVWLSPTSSHVMCLSLLPFCFGMGCVFANAATCAMDIFSEIKGAASAVLCSIESLVPVFVVTLLGLFHDGTMMPAGLGILSLTLLAFWLHRWLQVYELKALKG